MGDQEYKGIGTLPAELLANLLERLPRSALYACLCSGRLWWRGMPATLYARRIVESPRWSGSRDLVCSGNVLAIEGLVALGKLNPASMGWAPLLAAKYGHWPLMHAMHGLGVPGFVVSVINEAASQGNLPAVRYLVRARRRPFTCARAVAVAAKGNHADVVRYLVSEVGVRCSSGVLYHVTRWGNAPLLRHLLSHHRGQSTVPIAALCDAPPESDVIDIVLGEYRDACPEWTILQQRVRLTCAATSTSFIDTIERHCRDSRSAMDGHCDVRLDRQIACGVDRIVARQDWATLARLWDLFPQCMPRSQGAISCIIKHNRRDVLDRTIASGLPLDEAHLAQAAFYGHVDLLRCMLDKAPPPLCSLTLGGTLGATDVSGIPHYVNTGAFGGTLLGRAASGGHVPVLHLLRDRYPEAFAACASEMMLAASIHGKPEALDWIVAHSPPSVAALWRSADTECHEPALIGLFEAVLESRCVGVVEVLLRHGVLARERMRPHRLKLERRVDHLWGLVMKLADEGHLDLVRAVCPLIPLSHDGDMWNVISQFGMYHAGLLYVIQAGYVGGFSPYTFATIAERAVQYGRYDTLEWLLGRCAYVPRGVGAGDRANHVCHLIGNDDDGDRHYSSMFKRMIGCAARWGKNDVIEWAARSPLPNGDCWRAALGEAIDFALAGGHLSTLCLLHSDAFRRTVGCLHHHRCACYECCMAFPGVNTDCAVGNPQWLLGQGAMLPILDHGQRRRMAYAGVAFSVGQLAEAAKKGHLDVLHYLWHTHGCVDMEQPVMRAAIIGGHLHVVRFLYRTQPLIDVERALECATVRQRWAIVEWLKEAILYGATRTLPEFTVTPFPIFQDGSFALHGTCPNLCSPFFHR